MVLILRLDAKHSGCAVFVVSRNLKVKVGFGAVTFLKRRAVVGEFMCPLVCDSENSPTGQFMTFD